MAQELRALATFAEDLDLGLRTHGVDSQLSIIPAVEDPTPSSDFHGHYT